MQVLGLFRKAQPYLSGEGFAYSHKFDCTTADASLGASDYLILGQKIEGINLQHLKYGTSSAEKLTLSFWVRSAKTGTYCIEYRNANSGGTRTQSQSYTISAADTWEKKTITIDGDTATAFDNTTNSELEIYFWLAAGSNFTSGTLATSWASDATANRAVGQVNLADSTSNDWYITGVQLEVGDKATPFEHLSYGEELALCQRYFQKYGPYGTNVYPLGPSGYCYAGTAHALGHNPIVSLRANPDLEITGTLQIRGAQNDGGNDARDVASATVTLGNNSILWNVNAAAGATIGTTPIVGGGTNTTFFAYDAEL